MTIEGGDPRSEQLNQIFADYLKAVESGKTPGRDELIQQHPDLADDLQSFHADHDQKKATKTDIGAPTLPKRQADTDVETISPGAPPESPTLRPRQSVKDTTPRSSGLDNYTLPPSEQTAEAPPVGAKIRYRGDYELLDEIARGGMGVVDKVKLSDVHTM